MSVGGGKERGPLKPVGRAVQEEIERLVNKGQALTKEEAQKKEPNAETFAQIVKGLPKLIQKTLAQLDAAQVYQTFKLPGRDYVVQDKRDKETQTKEETRKDTIAEESKKPLHELLIQKGKLTEAKEKTYENYLGEPPQKPATPEGRAAHERLVQFFSRFEKALVLRFEGGEEVAKPLSGGRFQFLKKTAQQWGDFFSRFIKRTVLRKVAAENVREWIYRGLVQREARATVISDWALAGGGLEKFVRFRLPGDAKDLAALLLRLDPGARLSQEELQKYLHGELEYLAIRSAEEELGFARAPLAGKFLTTLKAEEKVASDLGVQLGGQLREKEKVLRDLGGRRRGFPGGGFGGEAEGNEQGSQFIPWWQYGPLKKFRTPLRWFLFACLIALVGLALAGLF